MQHQSQAVALLRSGLFAPRSTDEIRANEIVNGVIHLGKARIPLDETHLCSSQLENESYYLALHSLRWLDHLLRVEGESYEHHWVKLLELWWSVNSEVDTATSRVWSFTVLSQRVQAIALGQELISQLDRSFISVHFENLANQLEEAPDPEALRRAALALLLIAGEDKGLKSFVGDQLKIALERFVRPSGGLFGKDLQAMAESRSEWEWWFELLLGWGVDLRGFRENLYNPEFWLHMISPNGRLVPLGTNLPSADSLSSTFPEMAYMLTKGAVGSPPGFSFIAEEEGISSSRSGWGETERLLDEETHWTLWSGPARGRDAHQDGGRLTFSSRGIDWLIDIEGEQFANASVHSGIEIEGRPYRSAARSSLVRADTNSELDEVVVTPKTFLPAQWTRDVIFVKSKFYLVVKDIVRASRGVRGRVNWIINPDADLESRGHEIRCCLKGKSLSLSIFGVDADPRIEYLRDDSGQLVGKRISVEFEGASKRIVTVISDVLDEGKFSVARKPAPGHWVIVDHRDKGVDERLVHTTDGSVLLDTGESPEVSIARAEKALAQGTLSDEQALVQRAEVREVIKDVKRRAWADPSARNRSSLIEELSLFASQNAVPPLRDHGLSAALVDLAGADLIDVVPKDFVGQLRRRSNLIGWGERDLQRFYKFPIHTSHEPSFKAEVPEEDWIWSVDCGQIVPSALIRPKQGDTLMVYLHGATDRTRHALPRYERVRSFSKIAQGPVAFFSDPTLDLDNRMILSWYMGTEEVTLHRTIAQMIDSIAKAYEVDRVTVVGNSGGGFSAMQIASYLDGASFVSVNGQSDIGRYTPLLAEQASWASFGKKMVCDLSEPESVRSSVLRRFEELDHDVRGIVVQNTGDDHHYSEHYLPLKHQVLSHSANSTVEFVERFMGEGHVAPTPAEYEEIVTTWMDRERERGASFRGLRFETS